MLTWTKGTGHTEPIYIGRVIGGEVKSERERQMRLRTYYVRKGDGTGGLDMKSRWYVSFRDGGDWINMRRFSGGFRSRGRAYMWCEKHLVEKLPKIRLTFVGRAPKVSLGDGVGVDVLVWRETGDSGRTLSTQWCTQADEFYQQMIGA